ncbi:MAG TPA: sensor histidine kinase [Pseudonocardiaceae bacterium]|nr:sensor histidine kinase [Pseudonocardiaceae bacterium]
MSGDGLARSTAVLALAGAVESILRALSTDVSAQLVPVLCLLALATTLPLALLRPVAAAVAVVAASVVSLVFFHGLTVAGGCAVSIVLYLAGRRTVLAVGLAVPFLLLALVSPAGVGAVLLASLAPAAALVGVARQAQGEAVVHRAARQAVAGTLLEHTARGERARIARELHDVVAHHISMIAVQAETARLTVPGLPTAGAQRLSEIGDTARAGLTEMRRLLGVLREDTETADRHPQPGLEQLNELLDDAREMSGAATRLIVAGPPVPLDPGVELAAYRIVQEALTNTRRHAAGAAVDVELHYTADALRLRIRDNGPGSRPSAPTGGHGLTGMRERAVAVGGHLRTGHAAVGGFLVEATLPVAVAE